jgi:hypothetical protein
MPTIIISYRKSDFKRIAGSIVDRHRGMTAASFVSAGLVAVAVSLTLLWPVRPALSESAGGDASVAPKAVLYEEDPADPQGRRYVGSAIWRTERVAGGPSQPEQIVVHAGVEIPERQLAMDWAMRRNTDPSLPATHTIEIMFRLPPDFPSSIVDVPGILMKRRDQERGVRLAGSAVKIIDSHYLIGLSLLNADAENNLRMLEQRGWFDLPFIYSNKRRAILAFEKGAPGDRAFAEALAAWRQKHWWQ